MAEAFEKSKSPPGVGESGPSVSPSISDAEAGHRVKDGETIQVPVAREGLSAWKWIVTLIGLYLGAMLYGT